MTSTTTQDNHTQDHSTSQNITYTNFSNNDSMIDLTTQTLLMLTNCNKMYAKSNEVYAKSNEVYAKSNEMYAKSQSMMEEVTSLIISARTTFKDVAKLNYSKSSKIARFHNYTPSYHNNMNLHNGIPSIASSSSMTSSNYQSDCVDVVSSPIV